MAPEAAAATILEAAKRHGFAARRLGVVTPEAGVVRIPQWNLVGTGAKGSGGSLREDRRL
jgi:hypothetical protein